MILISACMAGKPCRYNGTSKLSPCFDDWKKEDAYRLICPEGLGGLTSPRLPSEIVGGDGHDVLEGKAKVLSKDGEDLTDAFMKGAYRVLEIAKQCHAKKVYLKSKSPSCGVGRIYDGSFSGKIIDGDGVTAALLKQNGFCVVECD